MKALSAEPGDYLEQAQAYDRWVAPTLEVQNPMTTISAPAQAPAPLPDEPRFLLRGVDWATYRKISDALSGRHVRLTYDRGSLEFMTPTATIGG